MNVRDNNTVRAFIVGLDLADAQDDGVGGAIGDELVATTFDDLTDSLVEFECRGWIALDLYSNVTGCV